VFRRRLGDILQTSLGAGRQAYCQEISAYVRPWAHILPTVEAPVTLWHGRSDNWSPPAMSDALAARIPQVTEIRWLEGLSHYSALRAALPQILDR
jgi:pimeloyl-ACP methyl ester carboxylesterase